MLRLPLCVYPVRLLVHATRYPLTQSHSRPYPPPRTHKRNDEGNTPAHLNTKSELSQALHDHSQGTLPPFINVGATFMVARGWRWDRRFTNLPPTLPYHRQCVLSQDLYSGLAPFP